MTEAIQARETQGVRLLAHANSIKIVDQDTRYLATEFTSDVRGVIKSINDEFRPDIEKAHELHKDLLARLKRLLEPFNQAKNIIDREIGRDYQERKAEAERIAREKAAEEQKAEEDRLAAEAEKEMDAGNIEVAETLLDTKVEEKPIIDIPVQQTTVTQAGSASVRMDMVVEVMSKRTILGAILDNKLPDTLVTVELGMAKRYAKASGLKEMPGFKITETPVVSGRSR